MVFSREEFLEQGFIDLGPVLDKKVCQELLDKVFATRDFSSALFIDEKTHKKYPRYQKTNPGPGINLVEKYNLDFIEGNSTFKDSMKTVLGENYKIILKKFIVGVPDSWIPEWVARETDDFGVANLGPYIKSQFHDMTYFHSIDFHQDLIDHPNKNADFITLYVYFDEVDEGMSPLVVVPRSHIFGATVFPHKITIHDEQNTLTYEDGDDKKENFDLCFCFISFILH